MTKINMKRAPLFSSIGQMEEYLKASKLSGLKVEIISTKNKYEFINNTLWDIKYHLRSKGEKQVILKYLKFFTGYSGSHLKRLANQWRKGTLKYNPSRNRNKFHRIYFPRDIALLIETDVNHGCLSGKATRKILEREYKTFGRTEYANISNISTSHIYNIRNKNNQYRSSEAMYFHKTKRAEANIGIRKKPEPNGKPGYVRVDTVHQGDLAKNKGVYHINIVDEVTQYELVACVEKITERYLKPVVEELLKLFPFVIYEFHSDNGSEYINRWTAELLNKVHIRLTKSRSRHSNDNALVESKNGSIIRKMFGRNFIPGKWAKEINKYDRDYFNIYINYHRPCAFAENYLDKRGKIRKRYTQWMTPYEKLKSLNNAKQYLKEGFSFEELDRIAYEKSDNEFAEEMNRAKRELFKKIAKDNVCQKMREEREGIKNPLEFINLGE